MGNNCLDNYIYSLSFVDHHHLIHRFLLGLINYLVLHQLYILRIISLFTFEKITSKHLGLNLYQFDIVVHVHMDLLVFILTIILRTHYLQLVLYFLSHK